VLEEGRGAAAVGHMDTWWALPCRWRGARVGERLPSVSASYLVRQMKTDWCVPSARSAKIRYSPAFVMLLVLQLYW
jgi:hypothetical protein